MTNSTEKQLAIMMQLSVVEDMKREIKFLEEQVGTYEKKYASLIGQTDSKSTFEGGMYAGYKYSDQSAIKTIKRYVEKLEKTIEILQEEEGKN